LHKRPSQE